MKIFCIVLIILAALVAIPIIALTIAGTVMAIEYAEIIVYVLLILIVMGFLSKM